MVAVALTLLTAVPLAGCGSASKTVGVGVQPVAHPLLIDLGTLGGGGMQGQNQAAAVSGNIVVGWSSTSSAFVSLTAGTHAFAYDLGAASPKIRDLGTLGGHEPTMDESQASAVSGSIVAGYTYITPSGPNASVGPHAFAYDIGAASPKMLDLGAPGAYGESHATAVSGKVVVGYAVTGGTTHAFAYDLAAPSPMMLDLGTLGGSLSWPTAMSGNIVVGYSTTAGDHRHAFAYDLSGATPQMLDLGTLGGEGESEAKAVSGKVVVGISNGHAFAYDLGAASPKMLDLGTLGANYRSEATAVSGNMVVGFNTEQVPYCGGRGSPNCPERAFAYNLGAASPKMLDLGPGEATAVSDNIVVGNLVGLPTYHAFACNLSAASPKLVDLGTLGGDYSYAAAVSGAIVAGAASTPDGATHPVVWNLTKSR